MIKIQSYRGERSIDFLNNEHAHGAHVELMKNEKKINAKHCGVVNRPTERGAEKRIQHKA